MSDSKPEYRLSEMNRRGSVDGPLRILPLEVPTGAGQCGRREFLSAGITIGLALAVADGAANQLIGAEPTIGATKRPRVVFAHRKAVRRLVFSNDGSTLVSCSDDGTAKVWDIADVGLRKVIDEGSHGSINAAVITNDNQTLITGGGDGRIRFWEMETGKRIKELSQRGGAINSIALSRNGRVLASVCSDGMLALRAMPEADLKHVVSASPKSLYSVDLINNDETVVVAGRTKSLDMWSVRRAVLLEKCADPNLWIYAVAFSPDSNYVAAGGTGRVVTVRGSHDIDNLRQLSGSAVIRDLTFSHDGELLVAVAQDGTVKIWRHPDGDLCHDLRGPAACLSVAISPDRRLVASGDVNGVIALWDLVANRLRGFLFDPEASAVDAVTYRWIEEVTRRKIVTTLPVGTAIPLGAECLCNTVPGRLEALAADPPPRRTQSTSRKEERDAKKAAMQAAYQTRRARALAYQQALAHQRALMQQAAVMQYQYYLQRRYGSGRYSGGSSTTCTCNQVCTCDTVSY